MKKTHLKTFADLDKIITSSGNQEKQSEIYSKSLNSKTTEPTRSDQRTASLQINQITTVDSNVSVEDLALRRRKLEDYQKALDEIDKGNKAEKARLEEQKCELEKKYDLIQAKVLKAQNQNLARANQLAQQEQQLKDYENKNHHKRGELDRRAAKIDEREKILGSLELDLSARIANVQKREAVYVEFDNKIAELIDEISLNENLLHSQGLKINELTETNHSQKKEIEFARETVENLNHQIVQIRKNYRIEVSNLLEKIDLATIELDKLRPIQKKYVVLSAKYKAAKELIRKLESAVEDFTCHSSMIGQFHLNNPTIIEWLLSQENEDSFSMPRHVTVLGEGPVDSYEWINHLENSNCKSWLNGNEWIIIGREGWNPEDIDALIAERGDESIRIVSQEMFLAAMISGKDPFDADEDLLLSFAKGHPALQYIIESAFDWPFFNEGGGGGDPHEFQSAEKSPLNVMGYKVGMYGLREKSRRKILSDAYLGEIPWVESDAYMRQWGRAQTRMRLRRMVEHIAMLIRKASGKYNMDAAISDWESDLDWLYDEFYGPGGMDFTWPF